MNDGSVGYHSCHSRLSDNASAFGSLVLPQKNPNHLVTSLSKTWVESFLWHVVTALSGVQRHCNYLARKAMREK